MEPMIMSRSVLACTSGIVVLLGLAAGGCYESHRRGPVPVAPLDAGCLDPVLVDGGSISPEQVDLLVMIDNSNSMIEEQASLVRALPDFVRAISSGDVDFDGIEDFPPVGSLRVGVVTSDMGTGGHNIPTCRESDFGDDGILRQSGAVGFGFSCMREYPSFLSFDSDGSTTPEEFGNEAGCVIAAGTGGCGFEQPLEAVLKAVTPQRSRLRFFRNSRGHGEAANGDFVRRSSILVVLVVSDENDCSAEDPDLFSLTGGTRYDATDLNIRCFAHADALYSTDRYVDGLLALRADEPGRLVYATIAGIPVDLGGQSARTILDDPRMEERLPPDDAVRLVRSCEEGDTGLAYPPRRLIEVGGGIQARGGRTIHQSICRSDYGPAIGLILEEVGRAARPVCR